MLRSLIRERLIMGALALMVFFAAFGFTFEPIVTVVRRSALLPAHTSLVARVPATTPPAAFGALIEELLRNVGATIPDTPEVALIREHLLPEWSGTRTVIVQNAAGAFLPVTVTLSGTGNETGVLAALRRIAAHAAPREETHLLPDGSTFVEIVADPSAVAIADLPLPITVHAAPPLVSLRTADVSTSPSGAFLVPLSCRMTTEGTRIVSYRDADGPISAVLSSVPAYLRDFSCFQAFSTFVAK